MSKRPKRVSVCVSFLFEQMWRDSISEMQILCFNEAEGYSPYEVLVIL